MNGQGNKQYQGLPEHHFNQIRPQPGINNVFIMPLETSPVGNNQFNQMMGGIAINNMNRHLTHQIRPDTYSYMSGPIFTNRMMLCQMHPDMHQQPPMNTIMMQPNLPYTMPSQNQTLQQPPLPPREKKLLRIIDPKTNTEISIGENDANHTAEPSKSKSTSLAPVSVSEESSTSTDEIKQTFTYLVTSAAKQGMKVSEVSNEEEILTSEKSISKEPTIASNDVGNEDEKSESESEAAIPEKEAIIAVTESETPRLSSSEDDKHAEEIPFIVIEQPVLETGNDEEKSEVIDGSSIPEEMLGLEKSMSKRLTSSSCSISDEEKVEYEAVDDSSVPKKDKQSLLTEYEQKIDEYTQDSTNIHNMNKLIYNRELVELIRQINKEFNIVPCPFSEEKLREFGIDRGTMPPPIPVYNINRVKSPQCNNFNPQWAQNNKNAKYSGRYSENKRKKYSQQQKPFSGRPSIQRVKVDKITRGKDAWVPVMIAQKTGIEDTADRIEKVRKEIRGLLNKITPSTYDELSREFINKKVWQDLDTLPTVVELIFTKAVEEPTFVGVYSDLCRLQHEAESSHMGPQKEKHFHTTVVRKCQNIFEGTIQTPAQAALQRVEEKLLAEEDPKKKEFLKEEIDELKGKEKRYMLGTIKFISHLYRINLLNWKVIHFCIVSLLRKADESGNELDVEFSLNLLESVGLFTNPSNRSKLDEFVVFVSKFKPKVSNRVRFMILGLEDLRAKGWEAKNQGPKTKEEVKADVIKEEAQNKRERDAYEMNTLKKPTYSGRASGPPYSGHPSKDNKNDRKAAAVIAASTTGGSVKKDLKLQNVEKTDKLSKEPWKPRWKERMSSDDKREGASKKNSSFEQKSNSSGNLKNLANQKDNSKSISSTSPPKPDSPN